MRWVWVMWSWDLYWWSFKRVDGYEGTTYMQAVKVVPCPETIVFDPAINTLLSLSLPATQQKRACVVLCLSKPMFAFTEQDLPFGEGSAILPVGPPKEIISEPG